MNSKPRTNSNYLFCLPHGFKEIKYQNNKNLCHENHPLDYSPVSLMFSKTMESDLDHNFFNGYDKLDTKYFPESLTALTLSANNNPKPLIYLGVMDDQLKRNLPGFQNDFSRAENNKKMTKYISQSFFQTNFKIYRLSYCWIYQSNLIIITLTVEADNKDQGWQILKKFSDSFKLL